MLPHKQAHTQLCSSSLPPSLELWRQKERLDVLQEKQILTY